MFIFAAVLTASDVLPSVTVVPLDRPFVHDRARVRLNGKWGFIDSAGRLVIKPVFHEARPFCPDGLAPVRKGNDSESGWSFIDTEGREIVSLPSYPEPEKLGCFSEGLLAFSSEHRDDSYFIDRKGRVMIRDFSRVTPFSEGLAAVQIDRDGPWGYIDRDGVLRILPRFQSAEPFSDGRAMVGIGEDFGYVDRNGEMVVAATFRHAQSYQEKHAVAMHPPGWTHEDGLIDAAGTFVTRERYRALADLSEGLAFFMTHDGSSGYINSMGDRVIDLSGGYGRRFSEGLAGVSREGKWGYVNRKGRWVITPQYDDVDEFSEGRAAVKLGDEIRYIDKSGKVLWRSEPIEARLRAEALREREEKRRATAKVFPDPYANRSEEELFDLLIRESRLDVLPALIKTVPVGKLVNEVHQRLPAAGPDLHVHWVLDKESEHRLHHVSIEDFLETGNETLHLLLREGFSAEGPDSLGNKFRHYSQLFHMKRSDGRWTSSVPVTTEIYAGEAKLILHESGSTSILFEARNNAPSEVDGVSPGEGQIFYAEEAADGWTYRKLLARSVPLMHGFDVCRTNDGAWQVAWAPFESTDVTQPVLVAPLTTGYLDPEVVIRRHGHDLTDPRWIECGRKLAAESQVSDSGKVGLMLYHVSDRAGEAWRRLRPDQRSSKGYALADDIDLGLAASTLDRSLLAVFDGATVIPFALAPEIERLPPFETYVRLPSEMRHHPALIELARGEPALLMPYEGTAVLIKASPAGSQAVALHLPGEGRLNLGPPLRSGDRMHLAFSRAHEGRVRVGVVEIELSSLQWAALATVLINATPAETRPPGENVLIRALWDQAIALYDSNHWPAAADILARLSLAGGNSYERRELLQKICELHPAIAPCLPREPK